MKRGTPEHPKMKKFARLIGQPIGVAVGALESLWHWTARYCPRGDIGKYDDEEIAEACAVGLAADKIIPALIDSGWVDIPSIAAARLVIHDWPEHCDDAVHMALARGLEVFADDSFPKLTRFSGEEKKRLEAHYASVLESRAHAVHMPCTQEPDVVTTALAPPKPRLSLSPAPPLASCAADAAGGGDVPGPESIDSKPLKQKRVKPPTDPELLEWIDDWNALPTHIRGPTCNRDPPAKVVLRAWERRCRDSELRRIADDKTRVIEAVTTAAYCHGKPWFTFAWLFATGQTGEWNCEKLLNGAYRENRSGPVKAKGDGRIATDSRTLSKIKYFTPGFPEGVASPKGADPPSKET